MDSRVSEIIKAYRNRVHIQEIVTRFGLSTPRRLYELLREYNEPKRGRVKGPRTYKRVFCCICGKEKQPPPNQRQRSDGAWKERVTCGHIQCRQILKLRPELWPEGIPHQKGVLPFQGNRKTKIKLDWDEPETDGNHMRELYAHEESAERFFVLGEEDVRGTDISEEAYLEPWGTVSQTSIAIKLVGHEGEASLTISLKNRSSQEAFIQDFCGGNASYLDHFQLIYVWRCRCDLKTRREWSKLEELPDECGFHVACPGCGSVALEIIE